MSSAYAGVVSRKGEVLLPRLGVNVRFESTIEERFLRILDNSPAVTGVERGQVTQVVAPDGVEHTYTPDFIVSLGQRVVTVECKPQEILGQILRDELIQWRCRQQLFQMKGQPLYLVTDQDLSATRLAHVIHFGGFVNAPQDELVRRTAINFLHERGAVPVAALRQFVMALLKLPPTDVDGTIFGMIARHEIVADSRERPLTCAVDLPGRQISSPVEPLGKPLEHYLAALPPIQATKQIYISSELRLEAQFLETARGQHYLRLFSACQGDPVQLTAQRQKELAEQNGMSRKSLERFKSALIRAGAPGITFTQLVPYIFTERVKATNQVTPEVCALMEDLINREYFVLPSTGRARTVADLHERIRKACLSAGLIPPSYNTVHRHIIRFEQRDPVTAALRRHGRDAADKLIARHGKFPIQLYGELLAVDCTPCDVFTISGQLTVRGISKKERRSDAKRGYVVVVVDVATSQVVASSLFDGPISGANILEVLRRIFLGDHSDLVDLGVKRLPQGKGLPLRIRMDSGGEFLNQQVERVLNHLGVEVLRRNKATKYHGGSEERTIQTLIHSHHTLDGTSMHNIQARGEYPAQLKARLTLAELDHFHQLVVERHNSLTAPQQTEVRHQHAARLVDEGQSVWRPLSAPQLEYVERRMMPMETCVHLREGLKLLGLVYVSAELKNAVPLGQKVHVFYSPMDVSQAEVVVPSTGELFTVYAHLPPGVVAPLSLKQNREINRQQREAKQAALDGVAQLHDIAKQVQERVSLKRSVVSVKVQKSERPVDSGLATIKQKSLVVDFDDAPAGRK